MNLLGMVGALPEKRLKKRRGERGDGLGEYFNKSQFFWVVVSNYL